MARIDATHTHKHTHTHNMDMQTIIGSACMRKCVAVCKRQWLTVFGYARGGVYEAVCVSVQVVVWGRHCGSG